MYASYDIKQLGDRSYQFVTDFGVEYRIILEDHALAYKNVDGLPCNLYELSLKSEEMVVPRDIKTGLTLVHFLKDYLTNKANGGLMYRVHNKVEQVKENHLRRGKLRLKLFERLFQRYGQGYIKLSNSVLEPPENDELLCAIIDIHNPNYKQIVETFYKFCNHNT